MDEIMGEMQGNPTVSQNDLLDNSDSQFMRSKDDFLPSQQIDAEMVYNEASEPKRPKKIKIGLTQPTSKRKKVSHLEVEKKRKATTTPPAV